MNPNDNQPVNSADYLNQISSQPTRNKFDLFHQKPSHLALIILAVVFAVVMILSVVLAMSGNDNNVGRLAARLTSTESTATSATANIKNTQLRALNSSLKLYMANTIRDATPIFAKSGITMGKLDAKVIASESNTKMLATLEDARLNAVYDRTYAREMAYQLDTLITLMRKIYNSTGNASLKNFLSTSYKSLEPTQKQFADFNAANS